MLSDPERRVLVIYCSAHIVATCEDCWRDYKFTDLAINVGRRQYYFCPSCRADFVDQLRLHILHCPVLATALEESLRVQAAVYEEANRVGSPSEILAAESHERAQRVLAASEGPGSRS